jgi:hypothetical protein
VNAGRNVLGSARTCRRCDAAVEPGDAYCRRCGRSLHGRGPAQRFGRIAIAGLIAPIVAVPAAVGHALARSEADIIDFEFAAESPLLLALLGAAFLTSALLVSLAVAKRTVYRVVAALPTTVVLATLTLALAQFVWILTLLARGGTFNIEDVEGDGKALMTLVYFSSVIGAFYGLVVGLGLAFVFAVLPVARAWLTRGLTTG